VSLGAARPIVDRQPGRHPHQRRERAVGRLARPRERTAGALQLVCERHVEDVAVAGRRVAAAAHALGRRVAAHADAAVGVVELQRRTQREVVLERHDDRDAGAVRAVDDRRRQPEQLLDVHHVRPEGAELGLEQPLADRLVELDVGVAGAAVHPDGDRSALELEHRDPAPVPAMEPRAPSERVAAAGEEVGHVVAARRLRVHHVLGVRDQAAAAPRSEAPSDVQDPHASPGSVISMLDAKLSQ
jgi:hypothetical protein